ncbi:MAG: rRNA maturation RNase YbeY [Cytophagales bacterium]|nr:rRNA maturation RNase YbeY [Cytophagales bacterium]
MQVDFFAADVTAPRVNKSKTTSWIKAVSRKYNAKIASLSFVFCSDSYLLDINTRFLKHSTLTDIITFPLSEKGEPIEAEIYISLERVAENAKLFKATATEELHRVLIHGVLHLCGFKDKTKRQKALMRKTEDACLSLRK